MARGLAARRAASRAEEILTAGGGALVPALRDALGEAEHARAVVETARALRLARSGEARARLLALLFDAIDAFDGRSA